MSLSVSYKIGHVVSQGTNDGHETDLIHST